jgi:hypothetical protein
MEAETLLLQDVWRPLGHGLVAGERQGIGKKEQQQGIGGEEDHGRGGDLDGIGDLVERSNAGRTTRTPTYPAGQDIFHAPKRRATN